MNAASALVLAVVVAGAVAVVWRNLRKGAPCSCGDDCGCCGRDCHCHDAGGSRSCATDGARAVGEDTSHAE